MSKERRFLKARLCPA